MQRRNKIRGKDNNSLLPRGIDRLRRLFEQEKHCVSIEIGERSVKIVQVSTVKGKRRLARLINSPFSSCEEAGISSDIKRLFAGSNIPSKNILLNIPRHLTTVRFLRLPSSDEDEIAKMVKMKSVNYLPYSSEEIIAGYRIIERCEGGYTHVLMAVVQTKIVSRLITILKEANISIEKIGLGSESLLLWLLASREPIRGQSVLLINAGSGYIDLDIIDDGRLVFTRGILSVGDDSQNEKRLLDEIKKSADIYKKESKHELGRVYMSGAANRAGRLKDFLEKTLGLSVEIMGQTENLPAVEGLCVGSELEHNSFVEVLGLSMRPEGVKVNLLPEDLVREGQRNRIKRNLLSTMILFSLIVVTSFALIARKVYCKGVYLSALNFEIKKMEPEVKKARKMLEEMSLVKSQIEKGTLAVDAIAEVHKVIPHAVSLGLMEFNSGESVTIKGNASKLNEVFSLMTRLEDSPYFKNVKAKYVAKRKTETSEVMDFEIRCALSRIEE